MNNKKLWNSMGTLVFAAALGLAGAGCVYGSEAGTEVKITLSDERITVDGEVISTDSSAAVYSGAKIVYYEAGKGELYGEGDAEDEHSPEEAAAHTVVTITQPGTYRMTGSLAQGQIAVDLGEDAEEDPNAVVNLILDNVDISCSVASGIVVFHAYECGSDDTETATKDVDTAAAGFNLILADDSVNTINGSHVAKIYKDGTTQEQVDADETKKKYKFDGAISSKVSMNIDGEELDNGKLMVNADNEGISGELHMTINGGEIVINSADDAINVNEDYVSVLTINDGILTCDSGLGKEGDGIDSNGWIVVNGGYTIATGNGGSMDSGVDADRGIYVNGGTLLAGGNMYDEIAEDSAQEFLVMNLAQRVEEGQLLLLKDAQGNPAAAFRAANACQILVYSSEILTENEYSLYTVFSVTGDLNGSIYTNITGYTDEVQLQYSSGSVMGSGFGGGRPFGGQMPKDMEFPGKMEPGQMPEDMEFPGGMEPGQMPEGMEFPRGMEPGQEDRGTHK